MSCPCRPSRVVCRDAARAALPLALATLLAGRAAAQQEAWRIDGVDRTERFGQAMTSTPDIDGDGIEELVVCAPPTTIGDIESGAVRVLSGATFTVLQEWPAPTNPGFAWFGSSIADAGDQDGDGRHDFVIGGAGAAVLLSSATGSPIRRFNRAFSASFGAEVLAVEDVDGDGRREFLIGAPDERHFDSSGRLIEGGVLRLFTAGSGTPLWHVDGSVDGARCGGRGRCAPIDDLDGDGIRDLAMLDREERSGRVVEVVRLRSSKSGVELQTIDCDRLLDRDARLSTIAPLHDVDGDGSDDLLVSGHPPAVRGRGFALGVSTGTGNALWRALVGASDFDLVAVSHAGDFDGDGVEEFAIGCYESLRGGDGSRPDLLPQIELLEPPPPVNLRLLAATLHRASDGASLRRVAMDAPPFEYSFPAPFPSLLVDRDVDGDGLDDLVLGIPDSRTRLSLSGSVAALRWSDGALIDAALGNGEKWRMDGPLATVGDVDGDGRRDLAISQARSTFAADGADRRLRIVSGKDGTRLRAFGVDGADLLELSAVPDLDGDGQDDLALTLDTSNRPWVEVRSTASGALLSEFRDGTTFSGFGRVLVAAVQPGGGTAQLAIAETGNDDIALDAGKVTVFDLATGAVVFEKFGNSNREALGSAIAYLGDVNTGGIGDWAMGAPFNNSVANDAGRVAIVSGKAGGQLKALFGGSALEEFGQALAGLGDVDADGVPDLAVAAPGANNDTGEVRVFSGATWTQLYSVRGERRADRFGAFRLVALGDVDGDGSGDWAAGATSPWRIEARSGADGALLARLDPPPSSFHLLRMATTADWQSGSPNGDAIRDLLLQDSVGAVPMGSAWLVVLDDLLLQIEPASPKPNDTVFAYLRGAPSGNAALLELVAIDGVPVSVTLDAGVFDAEREWFTCGAVPPGLSGTTWTLRGHATGWSGGLVQSLDQELTFE